ncbi:helix-turn-helix domain-containing protein [Sphingobium sp. YR768]|uniref:helix-turn-helix domain-containing protein n=1 Tax=Sphingobium sp. YR768 TaxID=1884365 RepID=UPI0008AECBF2|nr:AraC family transcriptional regulator [Sphingobium sp. YR768]SEQ51069.1 transcriptional regulator, AraC family [Sphingobium sp. YR768]
MLDRSNAHILTPAYRGGASASGENRSAEAIDPDYLLGLLNKAQNALQNDPQDARHYLDRVCRLLRQASRPQDSSLPLIPSQPDTHQAPQAGGLAGWQLREVTAYVQNRLGRPLIVEELALVASLSPGHFCRAFKVSVGETPHAYVIRQRIRRAQRLMLETGNSLSDIASACGLADQAHLTRLFKRLVGTTPLLWRRTWQRAVA